MNIYNEINLLNFVLPFFSFIQMKLSFSYSPCPSKYTSLFLSTAYCSPWGRKELDTTERLNCLLSINYAQSKFSMKQLPLKFPVKKTVLFNLLKISIKNLSCLADSKFIVTQTFVLKKSTA